MLELGRYTEAMEDLLLAEQIAEHDNLSQSKLHLYYGVFYFILASQTGSDIYIRQLIDHDRTAFWSARDEGDINTLYRAFGDMLIAYSYTSHLDSLKREVTELKRLSAKNSDRLLRISLFQYSAARANNARDYRRAALVYDSILSIIPSDDQTAASAPPCTRTVASPWETTPQPSLPEQETITSVPGRTLTPLSHSRTASTCATYVSPPSTSFRHSPP